MVACKPFKKAQNQICSAALQFSRRSRSQHFPQHQAKIECADVDQQPLQNVVPSTQGTTPHTSRLVAVLETAFDKLAASSQQLFAIIARHSALVGLDRLLFSLLAFPIPLASLLPFRDIQAAEKLNFPEEVKKMIAPGCPRNDPRGLTDCFPSRKFRPFAIHSEFFRSLYSHRAVSLFT